MTTQVAKGNKMTRILCGVCNGTGDRIKNGKRFPCQPCGGTGTFIGTLTNNTIRSIRK